MFRGSLLANCGRLAVRAVISAGVVESRVSFAPDWRPPFRTVSCRDSSTNTKSDTPASSAPQKARLFEVHSCCCGFPKDLIHGPSVVRDHGIFGDDACFLAKFKNTHVVGVADGVGGWRRYGIDPSEFSSKLMKICAEIVQLGEFEPRRPDLLLVRAFQTLSTPPRPVGSSTACVLIVHQDTLYAANLGDSGYLVLRNGAVICRSREQTHYFNAPFQLSLLPENTGSTGFIGDAPERAELSTLELQSGDIVVLATDGLWDNVPEHIIVDQLNGIQPGDVQTACNTLALTARRLAFDSRHLSPFAVKASRHGINAPGGKPDDITLVLLLVS